MNLHIISLGRHGEPVLRELEKAVCVAACCKALLAFLGCALWYPLESMESAGKG